MSKYKIAWLPGDGVGNDVMDATRIVLDALNFSAEYIHQSHQFSLFPEILK